MSTASAQRGEAPRLSGTIERVEGTTIYGKGRDGSTITLRLNDRATIQAVLKATTQAINVGRDGARPF